MTAPLCPLCNRAPNEPQVTTYGCCAWTTCPMFGCRITEDARKAIAALRVPPTVETTRDGRYQVIEQSPVAPDAEALVTELVSAVRDWDEYNGEACLVRQRAAEAALLSRLTAQPQVTVTASHQKGGPHG